jgi:ribosomal protein S18 acetylase RimI-like enzyme
VINYTLLEESRLEEFRVFSRWIFNETFAPTNSPESMRSYMDQAFTIEQCVKEFKEPMAHTMVAIDQDKIIGYFRIRRNQEADQWLGSNNLELQRFYLHPDFQGKGIAQDMMQMVYHHCAQCEWIWLGVWEHNPRAIQFYLKCGFERFADHNFKMGDELQTDWLMRKRIVHTLF